MKTKQAETKQEACDQGCRDHAKMMLAAISNATPILSATATALLALAHAAEAKPGEAWNKKVSLTANEAEAIGVAIRDVQQRLEGTECPMPEEIASAVAVKW